MATRGDWPDELSQSLVTLGDGKCEAARSTLWWADVYDVLGEMARCRVVGDLGHRG